MERWNYITEIKRCMNTGSLYNSFEELLINCLDKYNNNSVYSTVNKKPTEAFRDQINETLRVRKKDVQGQSCHLCKNNIKLEYKLTPRYRIGILKKDRRGTGLTTTDRVVHTNLK